MFNIVAIIKNNNGSFYNFETGRRYFIWPRLVALVVTSVILSWIFRDQTEEFLGAVLTVQSILVGFSFSVLFFLLSYNEDKAQKEDSIEARLRNKKNSRLAWELFYNVSYFNLTAIISAICALLLLMPDYSFTGSARLLNFVGVVIEPNTKIAIKSAIGCAKYFFLFILYFTLTESMYTFARTIGRTSYYFEKKLPKSE